MTPGHVEPGARVAAVRVASTSGVWTVWSRGIPGIVLCLILLTLFAIIVLRALRHAARNEDPFARFAAAGLAILFGLQSAINMAVNIHLMPAKGMTLPFVSYGGSSMISIAYGMGMLLALTRERPRAEYLAKPNFIYAGSPA